MAWPPVTHQDVKDKIDTLAAAASVLATAAADPGSPVTGYAYLNTARRQLRIWSGTAWYFLGLAYTLFADTFTRADSSSTLGSPWVAEVGTWGISSNQAYPVTGADGDTATYDTSLTDHTISATVATLPSGKAAMVVARYVDANNFYMFYTERVGSGVIALYKRVSGTTTPLASATALINDGDELRLRAQGSIITAMQLRAGVLIREFTFSDASLSTGTKVGLRAGYSTSSGLRFDDVYVDIEP